MFACLQVSDMAMSTPLVAPGLPFLGSDLVGVSRVDLLYLIEQVRQVGGAYGAWARYSREGLLTFMSFRDPKVAETLRTFRLAARFANSWAQEAGEAELLEALLPVISMLDHPTDNEQKGRVSLWQCLEEETPEHRKVFRAQVLGTTKDQLKDFAERLQQALSTNREAVVLIGPPAAAESINQTGEDLQLIHVE